MCILCVYEICAQGLGAVTVFDSEKRSTESIFRNYNVQISQTTFQ